MEQRIMETIGWGFIVGFGLLVAWGSKRVELQKPAMWMAVDWIICNTLFELMGPRHSTWLAPSFAAFVAAMIGMSALKHRSWFAWAIVVVFVMQEAVTVAAFLHRTPGTQFYFGLQNWLFALRWGIIGLPATYHAVDRLTTRLLVPRGDYFHRRTG